MPRPRLRDLDARIARHDAFHGTVEDSRTWPGRRRLRLARPTCGTGEESTDRSPASPAPTFMEVRRRGDAGDESRTRARVGVQGGSRSVDAAVSSPTRRAGARHTSPGAGRIAAPATAGEVPGNFTAPSPSWTSCSPRCRPHGRAGDAGAVEGEELRPRKVRTDRCPPTAPTSDSLPPDLGSRPAAVRTGDSRCRSGSHRPTSRTAPRRPSPSPRRVRLAGRPRLSAKRQLHAVTAGRRVQVGSATGSEGARYANTGCVADRDRHGYE